MIKIEALSHLDYPITYELTTDTGVQSNEFAIDQRTGVVDLLHTLDYESDPIEYHLKVKAIENRRIPATSTVNVNLVLCLNKTFYVIINHVCYNNEV